MDTGTEQLLEMIKSSLCAEDQIADFERIDNDTIRVIFDDGDVFHITVREK